MVAITNMLYLYFINKALANEVIMRLNYHNITQTTVGKNLLVCIAESITIDEIMNDLLVQDYVTNAIGRDVSQYKYKMVELQMHNQYIFAYLLEV